MGSHMSRLGRLFLRLHPADCPVMVILGLAVLVALVRLPLHHDQLRHLLWIHLALLAVFVACVWALVRGESSSWVQLARPALTVTVVFTLYSTLGRLGVEAMPYLADGALSRIDTWMFGTNPTFLIEPYLTPGRVEFFSFVYAAFIPYIYVTIALNCLGRPPLERDEFLTGWVFTYFISYLGYIFIPGRGPGAYHAADYQVALTGSTFYDLVLHGVEASG